jgi:translation initiation factor IF-2
VVVIRDGSLRSGEYVVAGSSYAPLRIMENFLGNKVSEARFSSPIMIVGFSDTPPVGAVFTTVPDKKAAIARAQTLSATPVAATTVSTNTDAETVFVLPIIIKSDVVGSIDAIKHELHKLENEHTILRVIHSGVGAVTEGDVKSAAGSKNTVIIGFNVSVDLPARELAERLGVAIASFPIIYELADWLPQAISARRPKVRGEQELGRAKVLKTFSFARKQQTIGCRVESGTLSRKDRVRLVRGEEEIGRGHVESLRSGRSEVAHADTGSDCGMIIHMELDTEPAYGDALVAFTVADA